MTSPLKSKAFLGYSARQKLVNISLYFSEKKKVLKQLEVKNPQTKQALHLILNLFSRLVGM